MLLLARFEVTSPVLMLSGLAYLCPCYQSQFYCAAQSKCEVLRPISWSCSWWGTEPVNSLAIKLAVGCQLVREEGTPPSHPPLQSRWGEGGGQLTCTPASKASSPVLPRVFVYSLLISSFLIHLCGFLFTVLIMFDSLVFLAGLLFSCTIMMYTVFSYFGVKTPLSIYCKIFLIVNEFSWALFLLEHLYLTFVSEE